MSDIHETVIVGENVWVGENVTIGPYTIIGDNVLIGDGTQIYSHCSIGTPGESIHHAPSEGSGVVIGKNCIIREFVTINSNLGEHKTKVGDNCYLMSKSHMGHDATLENNVVLCTGAKIGGHAIVGAFSYVGLNACTHQRSKLGKYCIVGAVAFFKEISPDGISWMGVPAKPKKVNAVSISRNISNKLLADKITKEAQNFLENWK
jgi:UDP-N-acetylglucosamine acyltransferase|tara:strand:+ start:12752 stop:13366 length:615 start_codon:yes stop_codon:yes gene_type:complete